MVVGDIVHYQEIGKGEGMIELLAFCIMLKQHIQFKQFRNAEKRSQVNGEQKDGNYFFHDVNKT